MLLNAGAAIYVGGGAASIADGVAKAAELIDNGAAYSKMEQYIKASNE